MDVPARLHQPPLEPLNHELEIARRGGQEVVVVSQPRDGAVVQDRPRLVANDGIANPARFQAAEAVRVDLVEQLAGVPSANLDLAQRADIDDTHPLPHGAVLALDDPPLAPIRFRGVITGALPLPHVHPNRAESLMLMVQRTPLDGRMPGSRKRAQRYRRIRWAARRDSRLPHPPAGLSSAHADR